MTPLSDALTAAQRSALAALEKAYVAGQLDEDDAHPSEVFGEQLRTFGVTDPVDVSFLCAALDVLREWGVSAPTMTERVTEAKVEPASDKQWTLLRKLAAEKGTEPPDSSLTKAQASQVIDELQAGTYSPESWRVPF